MNDAERIIQAVRLLLPVKINSFPNALAARGACDLIGGCGMSDDKSDACPICGGTEHVDPLPGTVGRRCVKCCGFDTSETA